MPKLQTPEQLSYSRGAMYLKEKLQWGGKRGSLDHRPTYVTTCVRIGKLCGVAGATIRRDAQFKMLVDRIMEIDAKLAGDILDGSAGLTLKEMKSLVGDG